MAGQSKFVDIAIGDNGNSGDAEGAGNAWKDLWYGMQNIGQYDTLYVKASGVYSDADPIIGNAPMALHIIGPYRVKGYYSNIEDGGLVLVDCNPNSLPYGFTDAYSTYTSSYNSIENFVFTNALTQGLYVPYANFLKFVRCAFINSVGSGGEGKSAYTYIDCYFANNGYYGIITGSYSRLYRCIAINNADRGFNLGAFSNLINSKGINNSWSQVRLGGHSSSVNGCTFIGKNKTTPGIEINNIYNASLLNNIIASCSKGILSTATTGYDYANTAMHNMFYDNTTNIDGNFPAVADQPGSIILTEDPFTDAASGDYTLKSNSLAKAAGADLAFTKSIWDQFSDSVNPPVFATAQAASNLDPGPFQIASATSGSKRYFLDVDGVRGLII